MGYQAKVTGSPGSVKMSLVHNFSMENGIGKNVGASVPLVQQRSRNFRANGNAEMRS